MTFFFSFFRRQILPAIPATKERRAAGVGTCSKKLQEIFFVNPEFSFKFRTEPAERRKNSTPHFQPLGSRLH
ncbi:MAG: hypothetical protein LUE17_00580 [Planctomycetaceae bacterium]|nr:hypothetical protein [Planctomycetaceae bacterium]